MKKVTEMFYLDPEERRPLCTGLVLILEDGTRVEVTSTDVVAWYVREPKT